MRSGAKLDPGLFSLTVPTGGGKTLASLAFALDHAIEHGLKRIIFVIPFTSIVEQNARVFRDALGDLGEKAVLEHHSAFFAQAPSKKTNSDYYADKEKLKLAMENWDAPIIVTTAVQFFESLFASRPSQCRKLHNIAGSVVILDEAQTIPLPVLRPCVATLDELALNYRTSIVLCTATQPALKESKDFKDGLKESAVRELAPNPSELFDKFERVRVRHLGTIDDVTLTALMREREQVLCIVNNRRHACAVYDAIADLPGAHHLSTLMCAKHRSQKLEEIRTLLKNGKPCRLISTSLIEAGVDVDFPSVLRAEAGLDSIAQAAGRCNREGRRKKEDSEVLVFRPENPDWAPPIELKQFAEAASEVLRQQHFLEKPLSPESITEYFHQLLWFKGSGNGLDKKSILNTLKACRVDSLPFEKISRDFCMIENMQHPVIVPFDDEAKTLLEQLRFVERCGGIARQLQPYLVQVPKKAFYQLRDAGAIQPVAPEKWDEQFWALCNVDLYKEETGLTWENSSFLTIEKTLW